MNHYFVFVLMCIFLILLPGPDAAVVTKNTLVMKKVGGFKTSLGICCALMIHTLAAIVGLSAIIVKSSFLFSIFKYVGAVYLIYLGIKTLWALRKQEQAVEIQAEKVNNHVSCFKQGFFTNILNPKVAIFFLTFFPQFVDPKGDTLIPFLIMGITFIALSALWYLFYVSLIIQISEWMRKPIVQKGIEGITGIVLIGFGIRLALEKAQNSV